MTYQYEISIEAPTELEADSKMKSLSIMAKKLNRVELEKMAHLIMNDPVKLALAKKALGV